MTQTFKLHDLPILTSTKRCQFLSTVAEKPRGWNGGRATRDVADALKWELASVSNMLFTFEKEAPGVLEVKREGKFIASIRYVPPAAPAPTAPTPAAPATADSVTTLLNAMAKALQELTITNKAITVQLDFQREQLDYQAQELARTQEEAAKLSSKLDYIASKSNSIAKAVKA